MNHLQRKLETEVKPLEVKLTATENAQTEAETAWDEVVSSKNTLEGELAKVKADKKYTEEELTSFWQNNFNIEAELAQV